VEVVRAIMTSTVTQNLYWQWISVRRRSHRTFSTHWGFSTTCRRRREFTFSISTSNFL